MTDNTKNTLVSVVMTTYNGERFLNEQLKSIQQQNYPNFEIIVVDDASDDNSWAIIKEFALHDKRIYAVQNEKRLGLNSNFAKAFTLANGNYIAPCDQDDIWYADKLMVLMGQIGANPMIFSDSELIDENGISYHKLFSEVYAKKFSSIYDPLNLVLINCISGHAMLFKREVFEKSQKLPSNDYFDLHIAFTASLMGTIVYYNKPLVKYRQHSHNTTSNVKLAKKIKVKSSENNSHASHIFHERMHWFYLQCLKEGAHREKTVIQMLMAATSENKLKNKLLMVYTVFKYRHSLLKLKKYEKFRNLRCIVFAIKSFNKRFY